MNKVVLIVVLCVFILTSCNRTLPAVESPAPVGPALEEAESAADDKTELKIKPFDDVRGVFDSKTFEENEYDPDDMITLTFNEGTVFKGGEALQKELMENGKNPGLGVRALHAEGITGQGINVAIIDQNLLLDHPEFSGKIAAYYDTGCNQSEDEGSMHAPAVTSLLVGNTIGVAPGAKVYFAAAPSWTGDSKYYADALNWIVEENRKLTDTDKIRVVSISAAPSGEGSPFTKNQELYDKAVLLAQAEGILVLDCRVDDKTGIIALAYYNPDDPDKLEECKTGWPSSEPVPLPAEHIGVPCSYRTVAEEYYNGEPSYQYTGQGGLSWGIPYAAGVLSLGWQVNPALGNDEIVQLLIDTGFVDANGSKIINPRAFVEAVKNTK